MPLRTHERIVIAHHLILTGYGHWLPNDPRGSGSEEFYDDKLAPLGPIHHGRKEIQPPKHKVREFYQHARPLLDFEPIWFDDAKRQAMAELFAQAASSSRYTVYACTILSNHAHLCVRRHRDGALTVWNNFAETSRRTLRVLADINDAHPVWSARPYKVFLYAPDDVWRVVNYIRENPVKERLPAQNWTFMQQYDGWPHSRRPTE